MNILLIFFMILCKNIDADINIFYGDEIEYESVEVEGIKKGGLPATVGMMKKLEKKYPNQLFILLNHSTKYMNISKSSKILEKAGVKALLIDSTFFTKHSSSIPMIGANIHYSDSVAKPFIGYKNIFIDNMKISIVGIVSKDVKLPEKYRYENIAEDLQLTLDLLDKTYSPDLSIVISNSDDTNIYEIVKNRKRATLLIDKINREDIDSIQKYNMISKKVDKNSLGLFSLQITNDKITDYKNIVLDLNIRSAEDIKKDKDKFTKIKELEKKEGKKATAKYREEIEKNLEKDSVEEDKEMKTFISENM